MQQNNAPPMKWTLLAMAKTNQVIQKCSQNSVENDVRACMRSAAWWLPQNS
jgi:hypothetical protein